MTRDLGWVYIMSSPSIIPLKIGYSSKDPSSDRVQELSAATGVPEPFEVRYKALVVDAEQTESKLHESLAGSRTSPNREFFNVGVEEAIRCIRTHADIEKEYIYSSEASDRLAEVDQKIFDSLSHDQKEEILNVEATARAELLTRFIESNNAADRQMEALVTQIKLLRIKANDLRSREAHAILVRQRDNNKAKARRTRAKYLAFAVYGGLLLCALVFRIDGPAFLVLIVGAAVAAFRWLFIDPREGLSPTTNPILQKRGNFDMDKLSDEELRVILSITDQSKQATQVRDKLRHKQEEPIY